MALIRSFLFSELGAGPADRVETAEALPSEWIPTLFVSLASSGCGMPFGPTPKHEEPHFLY